MTKGGLKLTLVLLSLPLGALGLKATTEVHASAPVFGTSPGDYKYVANDWAEKIESLNKEYNSSNVFIHARDARDSHLWTYPNIPRDGYPRDIMVGSMRNGSDFEFWKRTDPVMSGNFVDPSLDGRKNFFRLGPCPSGFIVKREAVDVKCLNACDASSVSLEPQCLPYQPTVQEQIDDLASMITTLGSRVADIEAKNMPNETLQGKRLQGKTGREGCTEQKGVGDRNMGCTGQRSWAVGGISETKWCDTVRENLARPASLECNWGPEHIDDFFEELKTATCAYHEVVIDANKFRSMLPNSVEAFFIWQDQQCCQSFLADTYYPFLQEFGVDAATVPVVIVGTDRLESALDYCGA